MTRKYIIFAFCMMMSNTTMHVDSRYVRKYLLTHYRGSDSGLKARTQTAFQNP